MAAIDHPRHLMLLVVATAVLALGDHWHQAFRLITSFALYGALHASALVVALRKPSAISCKAGFIITAACLSMLSVLTAFALNRHLGSILGDDAVAVLSTLASILGAASYAVLIRFFWLPALPRRAFVWIPLCCGLATVLALPCGMYLHTVGGWWFAVIWWCAFSLALCYYDGRDHGVEVSHVGHT